MVRQLRTGVVTKENLHSCDQLSDLAFRAKYLFMMHACLRDAQIFSALSIVMNETMRQPCGLVQTR